MQQGTLFAPPPRAKFHPKELKSVVQKHMRRGEVDGALSTAQGMMSHGTEHRLALFKRIPIIVAEDIGWEYLGRVQHVMGNWPQTQSGLRPEHDKIALQLIANLTALPKSKESSWLMTVAAEDAKLTKWYSPRGFERAIADKNYVEASRIGIAAHAEQAFLGTKESVGLVDVIKQAAVGLPKMSELIVQGALSRLAKKAMPDDEKMLIAICVLAVIDRPDKEPVKWPDIKVDAPPPLPETIPWYGLDGHTYRGSGALAKVGSAHGIEHYPMKELMFYCESIKLGPKTRKARWEDEALQRVADINKWGTYKKAQAMWDSMADEVKTLIEQSLANGRDWSKEN